MPTKDKGNVQPLDETLERGWQGPKSLARRGRSGDQDQRRSTKASVKDGLYYPTTACRRGDRLV